MYKSRIMFSVSLLLHLKNQNGNKVESVVPHVAYDINILILLRLITVCLGRSPLTTPLLHLYIYPLSYPAAG